MTKLDTPKSLRDQIIEAMDNHSLLYGRNEPTIEQTFDEAIMPVLQKAMDAGELLVGRNTKDRVPVHKGIMDWMSMVCHHVDFIIRPSEAVISRRKCLDVIYQFAREAEKGLLEAKAHNNSLEQNTH